MKKMWSQLSIRKKFAAIFATVGIFLGMEIYVLTKSLKVLSSVSSLIVAEGHLAKMQKDGVISLSQFSLTKDDRYFQEYRKNFSQVLAFKGARIELSKKEGFDKQKLRASLKSGGLQENVIKELTWLFRSERNNIFLNKALNSWKEGSGKAYELNSKAFELYDSVKSSDDKKTSLILENIYRLNTELTEWEESFTRSLKTGITSLEDKIFFMTILSTMIFSVISGLFIILFIRNLVSSLLDVKNAAQRVSHGDLSVKLTTKSNDEIAELYQSMNNMIKEIDETIISKKAAEISDKNKTLFLSNISHEFRTPISVILGNLDLIKNQHNIDPEIISKLDKAMHVTENLLHNVRNMIDMSSLVADKFNLMIEDISIENLVERINMKINQDFSYNSNIVVEINNRSSWESFLTDQNRLEQILFHLIMNAYRYTENGRISIDIENDLDSISFRITDTGKGLDDEIREKLFKSFSKMDSDLREDKEGIGLGLSVSSALAQAIGGKLDLISSKRDSGSVFRLVLYPSKLKRLYNIEKVDKNKFKDLEVLIVDDSKDVQQLFTLKLKKKGMRVDVADNGKEALEKINNRKYDIVLMDLQMPVMNGYEAISEIRLRGNNIPVVAVTAHSLLHDEERCQRIGFNNYITKPMNFKKLERVIFHLTAA